jgi:hypothetical protein
MESQEQYTSESINNDKWQEPSLPAGSGKPHARRKSGYLYGAVAAIVIGIVMLVLGFTKILPGVEGGGAMLAFFGVVLLALSFVPHPENAEDQKPLNEIQGLAKVFFSPAQVFQNLRRHPRWLGALLIMTIVASTYHIVFTQRLGAKRIVDFSISKLEQSGFQLPPAAIEQSRQQQLEQLTSPGARFGTVVSNFASSFIGYALLAAIYLLIVLAMGGSINFWQSLSAVAYTAFPVTIIRYLLNFIILFVKDPSDIHPIIGQQSLVQDNLGALVNPGDSPVLWVILSSIGILSFYWLWLTATSLKNTGERVSPTAAWAGAIIAWVVVLTLGIVAALVFPSFFS